MNVNPWLIIGCTILFFTVLIAVLIYINNIRTVGANAQTQNKNGNSVKQGWDAFIGGITSLLKLVGQGITWLLKLPETMPASRIPLIILFSVLGVLLFLTFQNKYLDDKFVEAKGITGVLNNWIFGKNPDSLLTTDESIELALKEKKLLLGHTECTSFFNINGGGNESGSSSKIKTDTENDETGTQQQTSTANAKVAIKPSRLTQIATQKQTLVSKNFDDAEEWKDR